MVGQIVPRADGGAPLDGLQVSVASGGRSLLSVRPNQFGEFHGQVDHVESYLTVTVAGADTAKLFLIPVDLGQERLEQ